MSYSVDGFPTPVRLGSPLQRPLQRKPQDDKFSNQTVECEEAIILNELLDQMLRRERAATLPPSYMRTLAADVSSNTSVRKLIRHDKSTGAVHGVSSFMAQSQRLAERSIKDPVLERLVKQAMTKAQRLQKMKGPSFEDKLSMAQQIQDLTMQLQAQTDLQHATAASLDQERATTAQLSEDLARTQATLEATQAEAAALTSTLEEQEDAYAAQTRLLRAAEEELEDLRDPDEKDHVDPLRHRYIYIIVADLK